MLMTTTDFVAGKNLEMLGLVQGNIVRTKHIGKALAAGFRSIGGGEIKIYTDFWTAGFPQAFDCFGVVTALTWVHIKSYFSDAVFS